MSASVNDIPQRQNSLEFQSIMKAASQAYDDAGTVSTIRTSAVLLCGIAVPLINHIAPPFEPIGATFGLLVSIAVVVADHVIGVFQRTGAKFQELFDTKLFEIPWNTVQAGERPDPEKQSKLSRRFDLRNQPKSDRSEKLKDWYPRSAGSLPLQYGRLLCQRANLWWDGDLRSVYIVVHIAVLAAIIVLGIIYGLLRGMSCGQFVLAVAVPMVPVGIELCKGWMKHAEAVEISAATRKILEETLDEYLKTGARDESELLVKARAIQDVIFQRRRQAVRLPAAFYWLYRDSNEQAMNSAADKIAAEAAVLLKQK